MGKFLEAPAAAVTNLPERFLQEAGMSFWCHLESVILPDDLQTSILSHVMMQVEVQYSLCLWLTFVVSSCPRTGWWLW